jgi:hypothetical protein
VLWVWVTAEGHSPGEVVTSENVNDTLSPWFGPDDFLPAGVVSEWSNISGDSVAVFGDAPSNELAGSSVFATAPVHCPKSRDVATQTLERNLVNRCLKIFKSLNVDGCLATAFVLRSNHSAGGKTGGEAKLHKLHAAARHRVGVTNC